MRCRLSCPDLRVNLGLLALAMAVGCGGPDATSTSDAAVADARVGDDLVGDGADAPQAAPATAALSAQILGLTFATSTSLLPNPAPNVKVRVSDPTAARAVFAALLALPPPLPGAHGCPNDVGVEYQLAFVHDQTVVALARIKPSGCQEVVLTTGPTVALFSSATAPEFWPLLAEKLGIPENHIYPYPCYAPTADPALCAPDGGVPGLDGAAD
jgi:hypothetical protein